METTDKQALIDALLGEVVLARLATANPRTLQPHVVPVWFWWDGTGIWISAFRSTRKSKDSLRNPRIAVLIEPKDPTGRQLQAVLLEGAAEVLQQPDERVARISLTIYERYVAAEGGLTDEHRSWAVDAENTLIHLVPEKVYAW
jgi:nitroimidazol reductase NimA-like FMN-containing flavoprotein (pyridoxamine 5'-phosphate oxidase superfamily)